MNTPSWPRRRLLQGGAWALLASSGVGLRARAATFTGLAALQKAWWPQAEVGAVSLGLPEPDRLAEALRAQGLRAPKGFQPQLWRMQSTQPGPAGASAAQPLGWLAADRVIGKYDWIDYASGFDTHGVTLGLEVLAYRESHGGEIRQAQWRGQFAGRKGPQALRWGDDIRNISGSTLSCQHVTEGMQRLSALMRLLA